MDILQAIVLGIVQAISEWLPLSSKTLDALAYTELFGGPNENVLSVLLFLHLGTLFAATIYFRREILEVLREISHAPTNWKRHSTTKIGFIVSALFFTGVVGIPLLLIEHFILPTLQGDALLSVMGAGLILTGFLLSTQHRHRWRSVNAANWRDGILPGMLQGLSVLPGVSRAGASTTGIIWRGFDSESAFHLSFLLSIPTVLLAEVILWGAQAAQGGMGSLPASDGIMLVVSSFIFGYLTIGALLQIARSINVASLAFLFGIMMLLFGLMGIG